MNQISPDISWFRYPAAVVVAFVASVVTLISLAGISFSMRTVWDSSPTLSYVYGWILNLLVGFNGVFFGSLCLRRSDRLFGAMVLLVLGICFEFLTV